MWMLIFISVTCLYLIGLASTKIDTVIVPGSKSNARFIASQVSAQLHWSMTRNLTWFIEYGHFFTGDFLRQSTPGKSINYWTGWLDIRF
jgi:hypothetical protein